MSAIVVVEIIASLPSPSNVYNIFPQVCSQMSICQD